MSGTRRLTPLLPVVLTGLLIAAAGIIVAKEQREGPAIDSAAVALEDRSNASDVAEGREPGLFYSLHQMSKASDLIVIGTVDDVSVGRSVGPADEVSVTLEQHSVVVEEVLKGTASSGDRLLVEETGWIRATPVRLNGSRVVEPGDRVLVGLVLKTDPGLPVTTYRLTSTQSRFFVRGDRKLDTNFVSADDRNHGGNIDVQAAERIAEMGLNDLVARFSGRP